MTFFGGYEVIGCTVQRAMAVELANFQIAVIEGLPLLRFLSSVEAWNRNRSGDSSRRLR